MHEGRDHADQEGPFYDPIQTLQAKHIAGTLDENKIANAVMNSLGGSGPIMPQFIQTGGGYTAGTSLLNLHKARDSNMLPDITNS